MAKGGGADVGITCRIFRTFGSDGFFIEWRIEGEHPYLYLDGIIMKRSWAGEVRNVSLLVASAVNSEGFREILGICEGAKEDKSGWSAFLRHLVDRGLNGVQLIISDACRGLMESAAEYLPQARWQRCMMGFPPRREIDPLLREC